MIPCAEKVLKDNPNLDSIVLPVLRAEWLRLEEHEKLAKKGSKVKNCGQATSSARKCGFPKGSVNLSNVGVYGTCGKCGKYEHFRCAKIKEEEKEDIVGGKQVFYCSSCSAKITFSKPSINHGTNPIQVGAQTANKKSIENVTIVDSDAEEIIEVVAVVHDSSEEPSGRYQCELCKFNVDSEDEIRKHMDNQHGKNVCNVCKQTFWDTFTCSAHMKICHPTISIKCK